MEDTAEVKKAMKKLGFPQVEGDTAPSAMIPKACAASHKQVESLSSLISTFSEATSLSKLQLQPLVDFLFSLFQLPMCWPWLVQLPQDEEKVGDLCRRDQRV